MIKDIVQIVSKSENKVESGTLYCTNFKIIEKEAFECIKYLESKNVPENDDYENKIGETVNLELNLSRLNSIGFYETCETMVLKNPYEPPKIEYYLHDIAKFSFEQFRFKSNYTKTIDLLKSIKKISKHVFVDSDIDNCILFREDKSLIVKLVYHSSILEVIDEHQSTNLEQLTKVYNEESSEKKLMFINELIDFLQPQQEEIRFEFLLSNSSAFLNKCNNAYQYYLRDFSSNKLKIELDSKALEFSQKIQGVINDSQTKLVTIPTAFVLVYAAFDFQTVTALKNIIAIVSLFMFAVFIQLFLSNQYTSLNFIKDNITSYRDSFKKNNLEKVTEKFALVDNELMKQRTRLLIVKYILWAIPITLLLLWVVLVFKIEIIKLIWQLNIFKQRYLIGT